MEIKHKEIKQLNITAVFEEIDYIPITAEKMRKIFELSEKERQASPFLESSPSRKILTMANRQKSIIIEDKRLQVNDNIGKEPTKSELAKYFRTAFNSFVDKTKLIDYGFNYDILAKSKKKINFKKLLGKDILKSLLGSSILESGTRVLFMKGEKRYDLQISPAGDPYKILFHLNTHYPSKKINLLQLQKQLNENYLELIKIIEKV